MLVESLSFHDIGVSWLCRGINTNGPSALDCSLTVLLCLADSSKINLALSEFF